MPLPKSGSSREMLDGSISRCRVSTISSATADAVVTGCSSIVRCPTITVSPSREFGAINCALYVRTKNRVNTALIGTDANRVNGERYGDGRSDRASGKAATVRSATWLFGRKDPLRRIADPGERTTPAGQPYEYLESLALRALRRTRGHALGGGPKDAGSTRRSAGEDRDSRGSIRAM